MLLADYTRHGFLDGVGIRLAQHCVRPGKPNKAASGFFSDIIREPLAGQEAVLPVSEDVLHTHATPRSAVGFLHSCRLADARTARAAHQSHDARRLLHSRRADRSVTPHGRRQGGRAHPPRARRLVMRIVAGWPSASTPDGRRSSASRRKAPSTRSSAFISRMIVAARSWLRTAQALARRAPSHTLARACPSLRKA